MIATLPEATTSTMTAEEFLSLPENGRRDQFLIRGKLWEKTMTYRNPFHSELMIQLGFLLKAWLRECPWWWEPPLPIFPDGSRLWRRILI